MGIFFVCFKWLCDDFFGKICQRGTHEDNVIFMFFECVVIACLIECERGLMVLLDTDVTVRIMSLIEFESFN